MKEQITIETLLDYLALYGGKIISTKDLQPEWIRQAMASDRMYVDKFSLGYVWEPDIYKLPENDKELAEFEKWFPLEVKMPDELKDASFLFEKRINPRDN